MVPTVYGSTGPSTYGRVTAPSYVYVDIPSGFYTGQMQFGHGNRSGTSGYVRSLGQSTYGGAQKTSRYRAGSSAQKKGDPYRNMELQGNGQQAHQVKDLRLIKGKLKCLRTPQPRTPLAEQASKQFVTLLPDERYRQDRRRFVLFVTLKDPMIVILTKEKDYAHVNGLGDHRYLRTEHRANLMLNPGSPTEFNTYIANVTICRRGSLFNHGIKRVRFKEEVQKERLEVTSGP